MKAVADWTETYRRFWVESFDRLGDYVEALQTRAPTGKRSTKTKSKPGRKASRRKRNE